MIEIPEYVKCYKNEEERLKMKQFFINNLHKIDPNKKTILFSTPSETGTSHFRLLEPLRAMFLLDPEKYNYIYTEQLTMNLLQKADLIVQHRAGLEHRRMLDIMLKTPHRKHCKVLHDVDDNEIEVPKSNPLYEMWMETGKDRMSEYQLTHCDFITTTTNNLRSFFTRFNKNVQVMRNSFDWTLPQWKLRSDWLEEKHKEGKIVIGWAGLTSHMKDIKKMKPIMKKIYDKYPNTHFVLAGMPVKNTMSQIFVDPQTSKKTFKESEVTDPTKTYKGQVKELYKDFDESRIDFLDVLPLSEYGKFYSMFDIGLAYIEDIKFDRGKSEIKIVEYLKYNAIPLFSKVGGYSEFYEALPQELKEFNMTVFSPSNEHEWFRKLDYILSNYESMKEKTKNLHRYILGEYSIQKAAKERLQLYEKLIS